MQIELRENIINQIKPSMNCLLSAAAVVCEEYGQSPELLFANCWGIKYIDTEKNIWDKLRPKVSLCFEEFLENYMGIHVDRFNVPVDEALKHINDAINEGFSIIVGLNAYYCPWNPFYYKCDQPHFCIVISIDYNNNVLLCKDPYISDQTYKLDLELFNKGYRNIRILKFLQRQKEIDYKKIYQVLILGYKNGVKDIEDAYKRCMRDFLNIKGVEEVFDDLEPETCQIVILLKQLSKNRLGISAMLLSLEDKNIGKHFIPNLDEDFFNTYKQWNEIACLMLKMLILKKINERTLQAISSKLEALMISEISIYRKINEFLCS